MASTRPPQICEEKRLAVVMYGGVSLAIYINGVAQELFNLVKATARRPEEPAKKGTPAVGAVGGPSPTVVSGDCPGPAGFWNGCCLPGQADDRIPGRRRASDSCFASVAPCHDVPEVHRPRATVGESRTLAPCRLGSPTRVKAPVGGDQELRSGLCPHFR